VALIWGGNTGVVVAIAVASTAAVVAIITTMTGVVSGVFVVL
jgi:hypothetical protein